MNPKINTYRIIAERILQDISEHVYPAGTRLPAERELAERFAVSRTTIREAIRYLESLGCVETRISAGSYVREPDMRKIATSFSAAFLQGDVMNCDVIEVRTILDTEVAAIAASRRTAEQLQLLKKNVEQMAACAASGGSQEEYVNYDIEFHLLLGKATNNAVLSNLIDMCEGIYRYTVNLSVGVAGMPGSGIVQHQELLTAIENRDVKQARNLMRQHILRIFYQN